MICISRKILCPIISNNFVWVIWSPSDGVRLTAGMFITALISRYFVGAWYHAIAANLSYSMLRHRRELSLPIVGGEASVKMLWTSDAPTLDEMQSARDLHDAIISALQDLSEVNRQAVIGYYIEGYNYTELAQLLGVPISTVKGRLFEGRRYLRGVLRPLAESRLQPTARKRNVLLWLDIKRCIFLVVILRLMRLVMRS
jgi:RNA polymerase sigma factor (sigma-70 family)